MKKTFALLLLLGTQLFAGIDERLEKLEQDMNQISFQTSEGAYGASFRSASPEVEDDHLLISFDILYWHPKVGGTEYAATKNLPVNQLPQRGRVKDLDLTWAWGFRAGVGGKVPHDNWDLNFNFTYFRNNDTSSTRKTPPANVFALVGFFGGNFQHAKSNFQLLYLNFDLELGRNYFISRRLAFRPHVGVKALRMHLREKSKFLFSSLQQQGQLVGEFYKVGSRSDSDGLGPRIGVQGSWFLADGFRLFSELAGALLYEYDEVTQREKSSPNASTDNTNIRLIGNKHHFTPFFQMYSGLSYGRYFHYDKVYLLLKFGYEVQYYFRQNQMLNPNNFIFGPNNPRPLRLDYDRIGEDVSLYGITFSANLNF
ncbi:MAG: MOMP family protein [Simkania sp.]|nr:MOMP family protein [Simkania sp.]MCP5490989.1 MOMP family protein [Chlamydiales bacterium]